MPLNVDEYGNQIQNPTPTTRLLEERSKAELEFRNKYLNRATVWRPVSLKTLITRMKLIISDLEELDPEKKFKFSLEISEE